MQVLDIILCVIVLGFSLGALFLTFKNFRDKPKKSRPNIDKLYENILFNSSYAVSLDHDYRSKLSNEEFNILKELKSLKNAEECFEMKKYKKSQSHTEANVNSDWYQIDN